MKQSSVLIVYITHPIIHIPKGKLISKLMHIPSDSAYREYMISHWNIILHMDRKCSSGIKYGSVFSGTLKEFHSYIA